MYLSILPEARSFCLVLLLDEVRLSSLGKMSYCIVIWAGINGPPQKLQCAINNVRHLRYSQLWYIGRLRSTFLFKIMAPLWSVYFSFGIRELPPHSFFFLGYSTHHEHSIYITFSSIITIQLYTFVRLFKYSLTHTHTKQGLPMYLLIWTIHFGTLLSFGAI